MNDNTLLRLALQVLHEIPFPGLYPPGLPEAEGEFQTRFNSHELATAIEKHLEENQGFSVILRRDIEDNSYAGDSPAATWEAAVLDVARQMLADSGAQTDDTLHIVDVVPGRIHASAPGVDTSQAVVFGEGGAPRLRHWMEINYGPPY